MSHLIMLAPANFGSALAQLGKDTVGRLKAWSEGLEPGAGVLDWLELGSPASWHLNSAWTSSTSAGQSAPPVFQFVLTGQSIDRALYDHVNSYTGETGSDGVVRVAAANLNSTYVRLEQEAARKEALAKVKGDGWAAPELVLAAQHTAPRSALAVLPGRSHSGEKMGILRSVRRSGFHPTVNAVIDCIKVTDAASYAIVCDKFEKLTAKTQADEQIEWERHRLLPNSYFVHDRYAQVIVRLSDENGYALEDFDLLLTAGQRGDPNLLPQGFFLDRQRCRQHRGTITYFLNWDVMIGCSAVTEERRVLRDKSEGAKGGRLGFLAQPRPTEGFVHYLGASFAAQTNVLKQFLRPNATLLVDIVLRRLVREGAFLLTQDRQPKDFSRQLPGPPIGAKHR